MDASIFFFGNFACALLRRVRVSRPMPSKKPSKAKTRERNHGRGADQTSLTISIPKDLREQIEREATAENRSLSNWMVTRLRQLMKDASTKLQSFAM